MDVVKDLWSHIDQEAMPRFRVNAMHALVMLYALADVLLTVLLTYKTEHDFATGFFAEIRKYTPLTSVLDFLIPSLLRFSVTVGCIIGVRCNMELGPGRLERCSTFLLFVASIMLVFSPLKLLLLDESSSLTIDWNWFWVLFCWNFVSSGLFATCICTLSNGLVVVGKKKSKSRKTPTKPSSKTAGTSGEAESTATDFSVLFKKCRDAKSDADGDPRQSTTSTSQDSDDFACGGIDEELEIKQSTKLMFRILKYCVTEWVWYLGGTVFLILYSLARVFIPFYTGEVISEVIISKSSENLLTAVKYMALLSLASALFAGLRAGFFEYGFIRVNFLIRMDLFSSLLRQEIGFFDSASTGVILSALSSDCQSMADLVSFNLNVFLRNAVMLVGSIIVMISLSWQLTTMNGIAFPLIGIISKFFGSYYETLAERTQRALATACDVAEEVISNMRTVRCFANEGGERERFRQRMQGILAIFRRKALAAANYTWLNELFSLIILVCALWYGGHLVIAGRLQSRNLISYLLYQLQLGEALINISSVYTGLRQAVGASRKVFQMIDRKPKIDQNGIFIPTDPSGQIEFRNVSFAYPTRPEQLVLNNVSFRVEPGETVALVGPSGSGKSSCISLLQHFYEPLSGEVLVDGVVVREYEHSALHKMIALVSQEPVLFARSIRENIAYGLDPTKLDQQAAKTAAELSNADLFISAFPRAYNTEVGEKGVQLSGGQKQRLAIARALIREPKILLLDEATSALDAESEFLVQEAIYKNLSGHTVLLIAHRLSTVERADRIIVIQNGRVVQEGTHKELLLRGGLYKTLVERQLCPLNKDT